MKIKIQIIAMPKVMRRVILGCLFFLVGGGCFFSSNNAIATGINNGYVEELNSWYFTGINWWGNPYHDKVEFFLSPSEGTGGFVFEDGDYYTNSNGELIEYWGVWNDNGSWSGGVINPYYAYIEGDADDFLIHTAHFSGHWTDGSAKWYTVAWLGDTVVEYGCWSHDYSNNIGLGWENLGLEAYSNNDFDRAPVPEPATMLLFATGLAGLAGYRRKKALKK